MTTRYIPKDPATRVRHSKADKGKCATCGHYDFVHDSKVGPCLGRRKVLGPNGKVTIVNCACDHYVPEATEPLEEWERELLDSTATYEPTDHVSVSRNTRAVARLIGSITQQKGNT